MGDRIRIKGDTAANLTSGNPTLHPREMCVETDTGRWKFGTGTSPASWNSLPYNDEAIEHEIDGTEDRIRFRNPNGTWGDWIYFSKPEYDDEAVRFRNPDGSWGDWIHYSKHEWDGTSIRFMQTDGSWGDWVDVANAFEDVSFEDKGDGTIDLTFEFAEGDPQTVNIDSSVLRDDITDITADLVGGGVIKLTFKYTYSDDIEIFTPDLTGPPSVPIWYDTDESHPSPTDRGELRYDAVWKKLYIGDDSDPVEWDEIEIGAGATGGGLDQVFIQNDQTVTTNYSIPAGKNAMSTGPVEIEAGVTVTIPAGSRWIIL